MKERPILFSGPMVRAILDGRKTQTRRIIDGKVTEGPNGWLWWESDRHKVNRGVSNPESMIERVMLPRCPYGVVGDRLWVRETWQPIHSEEDIFYAADETFRRHLEYSDWFEKDWQSHLNPHRFRSSIHMPRWASRITLEITNVRVERLQVISEADVLAEGFAAEISRVRELEGKWSLGEVTPCDVESQWQTWFRVNWDKINGKKHPWDSNPWVWALTFSRVL